VNTYRILGIVDN